jgi:hypothetical protein
VQFSPPIPKKITEIKIPRYAHFNYQAYDIANFFNEFTIDYICNSYPFFTVDMQRYPSEQEQRLFALVYLSEYLETPVRIEDSFIIEPLVASIRIFSMASNLAWGENDFDNIRLIDLIRLDSRKKYTRRLKLHIAMPCGSE